MASTKSQSPQSLLSEQSLEHNQARQQTNGDGHEKSDESAEEDVNGNAASDDGDGDLFGDGDDEEPYIKPYAAQVSVQEISDDGQWGSDARRCGIGFWR